MKAFLIFALLVFSMGMGFAQDSTTTGRAIDDVVVKETYQAELEEEKLPVYLKTDFSDLIRVPDNISWATIKSTSGNSNISGGWDFFRFKLAPPEIANIHPQPVKVFQVNFKGLMNWRLDITESNGDLFRSISGEGNPPESIPWDGLGDSEALMMPGHVYSYSFTAVDKAGNKRTFPGQMFSVSAVFFRDSSSVRVRVAGSQLFSADGGGLLPQASNYVREIAGLYHSYTKKNRLMTNGANPFSRALAEQLGSVVQATDKDEIMRTSNDSSKDCLTIVIE